MANPTHRSRMGDKIRSISKGIHILCLQEVHGLEGEAALFLSGILPGWKVCHSACLSGDGLALRASGGVLIAICPILMIDSVLTETVLIPGRCMGITLLQGDKKIMVGNMHNFGLSGEQIRCVSDFASTTRLLVNGDPSRNFGILVGDFNFLARGESKFVCGRKHSPLTSSAHLVSIPMLRKPIGWLSFANGLKSSSHFPPTLIILGIRVPELIVGSSCAPVILL